MRFTKMHGAGNDYVYINGFEQQVADPTGLAQKLSDRHFGVGGDGLVLILPSETADVRMQMFNADGSEGMMCGNAIRCVAKYAHERGLAEQNPLRVETASGIKTIEKTLNGDGHLTAATVDMGEPKLLPSDIPVRLDGDAIVDVPISANLQLPRTTEIHGADGKVEIDWQKRSGLHSGMTCVSMGNPHVVFFCKNAGEVPLEEIGPMVENASIFPERVNLHVVQISSADEVIMRTWERGSGITLACGTGAAAVCVAGVLTGRTRRDMLVHLPGGDLRIEWRESDNHVFMTGPATEVFDGEWIGAQEQ